MKYCKDAVALLGIKVICGKDCPILEDCPRIIMEDATDKAISKALKAMIRSLHETKNKSRG
jgi:hypothetical protein